MYAKSLTAAAAALFFSSASAHFFISSPPPVPGSAPKDPLDASGDNFPCHGADLSQGTVTNMQVGQTYPLEFDLGVGGVNTAVHGGGSCQISVAYSTDPTQLKNPSNWHVITSFVGGCPTNAMGNLPTAVMCPQSAPNCVNAFNFTIPQEVQSGSAILAWTWFNNVGNREMYMNCAKVSISGGQNQLSSLPNMMVANLASINQCKTTEDFNLDFPDPGKYVVKASTLNYPLKAPQDCAAAAGASASGSPGSSAPASGATSGGAAAAAPAAAASNTGGVFAPGAPSAPAAAPTTLATAASSAAASPAVATGTGAAPTGAAPTAAPAASSPTGSTTCQAGAVPCTASGFYCIDTQHFGECSFGCAIPQAMAPGTQCTNNAVSAIANRRKRFQPRGLRHAHKRHVGDSL